MTKIAITMEETVVREIDALVGMQTYPNRSRVIQEAVSDKLAKLSRSRLSEQCALLDPKEEQSLAEEFSPQEIALWQEC